MATPVVANILYGPAVIWHRPMTYVAFNPATLDNIGVDGTFPGGSPDYWERFGYTEGPTAFQYERTEKAVSVTDHLGEVIRFATDEKAKFTFTLKEVNPATFNRATGFVYTTAVVQPGGGNAGSEQFLVGDQPALDVRMWCISGTSFTIAGVAMPVRLFIWRGTARVTSPMGWEREETPKIEVEISALVDPLYSKGQRLFAFRKLWYGIVA